MSIIEIHRLIPKLKPALLFALLLVPGACSYTTLQAQPPIEHQQPGYQDSDGQLSDGTKESTTEEKLAEKGERQNRVAIATPATVNSDAAIDRRRDQRSATDELRAQARNASKQGEFDRAERLLNRALRIAPREPLSYYELAELKLKQQQPDNALQMARKGLSLQPVGRLAVKLKDAEQRANDSMF